MFCVHFFIFGLNLILDIGFGHQFFFLNDFVLENLDFFNLRNQLFNCYNLLLNRWNFLNFFLVAGGVNYLVNKSVHDLVLGDNHRFFGSDFNESGNFYNLLDDFFNLIDFGDFMFHCNDLVMVDWNFNYFF